MTYDTLWIGCSFSAGVYNKDNEILDKHQGIPNRLAQELSQKWKILTFPANGVHMFMQAIKVLDDKNLPYTILRGKLFKRIEIAMKILSSIKNNYVT